ncbi:GAF domain-containing protein, partial [Mesorhizobium japonicum]|uniref:GAF domain-containing protein n=1 Tax=Mesorhizobium japonicum TaxID=2066070 RepID=UPI003B5BD03E
GAAGDHEDADGTVYAELAERIADRISPLVTAVRPRPTRRPERRDREWDWSGTPAIIDAARRGGEPELRRLAEEAQRQFGVELAVVSIVDGDRLYHGTNVDVMPASVPLDLSFCRYTVAAGEPVVVPRTARDERFADNPLVDVSFVNFYAGYPLRGSDGRVIGSFCLQGSRPRTPSADELGELERMALEAQEVLRTYEAAPTDRPRPIATIRS